MSHLDPYPVRLFNKCCYFRIFLRIIMSSDLLFSSVQSTDCLMKTLDSFIDKTDFYDFCSWFNISMFVCYGILAQHPSLLFEAVKWSLDPADFNHQYRKRIKGVVQVIYSYI